jgi:hypothetical protein
VLQLSYLQSCGGQVALQMSRFTLATHHSASIPFPVQLFGTGIKGPFAAQILKLSVSQHGNNRKKNEGDIDTVNRKICLTLNIVLKNI